MFVFSLSFFLYCKHIPNKTLCCSSEFELHSMFLLLVLVEYCSTVFLDMQQAFDKIWRAGLLFKLQGNLPYTYYVIFKQYLENIMFNPTIDQEIQIHKHKSRLSLCTNMLTRSLVDCERLGGLSRLKKPRKLNHWLCND